MGAGKGGMRSCSGRGPAHTPVGFAAPTDVPPAVFQVCIQLRLPCSSITFDPDRGGLCANDRCEFALLNSAGTCCPTGVLEDPDAITSTPPPLIPPM